METHAVHLMGSEWTYLGGDDEAAKPIELVLRSYDQDVYGATGEDQGAPDTEPVLVPAGQGRRLEGKHFFVRPSDPALPCRVAHRGLLP